jgi:nucleotide-binding universal stress UspA family protein
VSRILIGVDASERSEDATAFGGRMAETADADIIVANAYPYSDIPSRASSGAYRTVLRDDALETVNAMRARLGEAAGRAEVLVTANTSPAHALHKIADANRVSLIVVGSTHTGRIGRVLPGSTAERLLHGSPCSVAVVPKGYATQADNPIRRIGVGYNQSDEARAAVFAAADLARAFGAQLEVIGVVSSEAYSAPALMSGGPSLATLKEDVERSVQESLDAIVAEIPSDVSATSVRLDGDAAEAIAERSAQLDLLVTGSRGYGPLHSVLVGGFAGRLVRSAQCPVIVVPRGIEAQLGNLFGGTAATAV